MKTVVSSKFHSELQNQQTEISAKKSHPRMRSLNSASVIFVRAYPKMWTSLDCKNPCTYFKKVHKWEYFKITASVDNKISNHLATITSQYNMIFILRPSIFNKITMVFYDQCFFIHSYQTKYVNMLRIFSRIPCAYIIVEWDARIHVVRLIDLDWCNLYFIWDDFTFFCLIVVSHISCGISFFCLVV